MSRSLVIVAFLVAGGLGARSASAQPTPGEPPAPGATPSATPGKPAPKKPPADLTKQIEALKAEIADLRAMAVQAPTLAASVQELSSRVAALEQELGELKRAQAASPEVIGGLDQLGARLDSVERDVEGLRTQLAGIEQPSVAAGGGAVEWASGFKWSTADGAYSLKIGGFVQPRLQLLVPEEFDTITESTFRLRRARLSASGTVGIPDLKYKLQAELGTDRAPALDYYLDYKVRDEFGVLLGQTKVYFTRAWYTSDAGIDFFERPVSIDNLRYDRDIGAWLHGRIADRLDYTVGASNGAGPNQRNDNIDVAAVLRLDALVIGEWFEPLTGDLAVTEVPSVLVGAGVVHDLVRLPDTVAGIEVGNLDVDSDDTGDNVRVWSASADAVLRYMGLEVIAEVIFRQERWGTILEHSDNQDLAEVVRPDSEGHKNYFGGYLQATYVAIAKKLMLGGRFGMNRAPVLGVGGLSVDAVPPANRVLEGTALVRYFHGAYLSYGLQYTLVDYNASNGPDPAGDVRHLFIAQAQLNF